MAETAEAYGVTRSGSQARWLISPAADLLVISNLTWPILLLIVWYFRGNLYTNFELYVNSVIGTPHRWVTLPIIAIDKERLANRWQLLLTVALSVMLLDGGLWLWMRDLGFLLMVRYLWNIWHVAAQHAGVSRIYAIRCQPEKRTSGIAEKYLLRSFIIYAFLRAGSIGGGFQVYRWLVQWIGFFSITTSKFDAFVLLIPFGLLAKELRTFDKALITRYIHLGSVCINYAMMIVFCHLNMVGWVAAISFGTAVFHALEYFGFLSWWMRRRAQRAETLFLPSIAHHWAAVLVVFLHCFAAITLVWAFKFGFVWAMSNCLVSYLHYAYDGVLWKMPVFFKSKPAAAIASAT